jgi:hypothetical protein
MILSSAIGMLVCLAMMMVVMPLGMRVAGRLRRGRANSAGMTEASADLSVHLQ